MRTGTRVPGVDRTDTGVGVTLDGGDVLEAELLLVAVGRGPVTDGLGLRRAGRDAWTAGSWPPTSGCAPTCRASTPWGTSCPGLQLAHRGFQQGIFVAEEIAGLDPTPIDEAGIPRVTYSHPEVASVGLTEEQARRASTAPTPCVAVTYDLAGNGKSQILKTAGLRQAGRAAGTGRWSASTWSATGSAS